MCKLTVNVSTTYKKYLHRWTNLTKLQKPASDLNEMKMSGLLWDESGMCLCVFWTKLSIFSRKLSNNVVLNTMLNSYYLQAGPFKFRMHLYLADNNITASTVNPDTEQFTHERQKILQADPYYLEFTICKRFWV